MKDTIDTGMIRLAATKALIFNKNKIKDAIDKLETLDTTRKFNPSSSPQKIAFFEYYDIESDNETPAGNAKWDRDEVERVQKLLKIMIEEKEN